MTFFPLKPRIARKLEPVRLSTKALHPVDGRLIERQKAKRAALPENSCKRVLLTDQPEPVRPRIDIPEHFPIG